MNFLLESPATIAMIGAVAVTMAAIVYASQRTMAALAAVVMVIALTAGAIVFERLWLTPSEQVRAAIEGLLSDIEANDLPAVLARLAPAAAEMRADAEALMPQFEVLGAGAAGSIEVQFSAGDPPASATARARVVIRARHRKSGMEGPGNAWVTFEVERRGDQWLVSGYSASEEWRKKASQLRGGR